MAIDKIKIAIVPKTKNLNFYEQSFAGCKKVAESHPEIECIYDGANNYQDIRKQALVVNELVSSGIDGLLISITDSKHLTETALIKAHKKGIPIITYDSDLLPEHQKYRLAYVGTDNIEFGKALAKGLSDLVPKTEKLREICIQSGHQTTPNLQDRVKGVRLQLSNGQSIEKLSGEGGWKEFDRCPLYTIGKPELALNQIKKILMTPNPPAVLAVAGFAQFSENYITEMEQFKDAIKNKTITIVSADTEPIQLEALRRELSSLNIGQQPYEMGRIGTKLLYQYIKYKERPKKKQYYVNFHYCKKDNIKTCTSSKEP